MLSRLEEAQGTIDAVQGSISGAVPDELLSGEPSADDAPADDAPAEEEPAEEEEDDKPEAATAKEEEEKEEKIWFFVTSHLDGERRKFGLDTVKGE
ncbi:MAG: hypothetical protein B6245_14095, partial [Desulfobacteraceae bacterium 4572_88]